MYIGGGTLIVIVAAVSLAYVRKERRRRDALAARQAKEADDALRKRKLFEAHWSAWQHRRFRLAARPPRLL
jgi:hypothetical protein